MNKKINSETWFDFLDKIINTFDLSTDEAKILKLMYPTSRKGASLTNAEIKGIMSCSEQKVVAVKKSIFGKIIPNRVEIKATEELRIFLVKLYGESKTSPQLWEILLNLAQYTEDKIWLIKQQKNTTFRVITNLNNIDRRIREVDKGKEFSVNIDVSSNGYLIALQSDESSDEVYCLAPSAFMKNNQVSKDKPITIPENFDSPRIGANVSGINNLLVIVIPSIIDVSNWKWMEESRNREDYIVSREHLQCLLEYIHDNNGNLEMFRTTFKVR
jgi:Domain of unknown function (DUF4384)